MRKPATKRKSGEPGDPVSGVAGNDLLLDTPDASRISSRLRADGVAPDLADALGSMFVVVSRTAPEGIAQEEPVKPGE